MRLRSCFDDMDNKSHKVTKLRMKLQFFLKIIKIYINRGIFRIKKAGKRLICFRYKIFQNSQILFQLHSEQSKLEKSAKL